MTTITASPPPARPAVRGAGGGPRGHVGGPWALVFVVVVFLILAAVTNFNSGNRRLRQVDLVAQQYADAWRTGGLSGVDYDPLSGPGIVNGDAGTVASAVRTIVHDLDTTMTNPTPTNVTVDQDATTFASSDQTVATTRLQVTWELQRAGLTQQGHIWTYWVTLTERESGGVWRVVWTPQTVHPALRNGLVFRVSRTLAPRAALIGAGDTSLPPSTNPELAKAVLGSIATKASTVEADQSPLQSATGDTIGVAGLQTLFDDRLAGGAEITVTAGPATSQFASIIPTQNPLFVGAPATPTPIDLTLDARTQQWAETALKPVSGPATMVVAQVSTGDVLAVADTSPTQDYGLSAQQPPGAIFGLASYLALLRQGFEPISQVDCQSPFIVPGSGATFRNAQGPTINDVRLAAAVEGGCTTGLARLYDKVSPVDVQTAAWDLGFATPLQPTPSGSRTPSWLTVADQLGTPSYLGRVASDSASDLGTGNDQDGTKAVDNVQQAENLTGEGKVLVSPLSVTRAMVTVAHGERLSLRLITNPAPGQPDVVKALEPAAVAALQDVLAKGVTELGGSAHALASLPGSPVSALAATTDYSTGGSTYRAAWVTGYRGDYAFTVLVPTAPPGNGGQTAALAAASRFLVNIP